MPDAGEQVREGSRVAVLWRHRARACGVSAHLRQAILRDHGAHELGGAVERAWARRAVPGQGAGGGRRPMARLVTVADQTPNASPSFSKLGAEIGVAA